MFPIVAIGASGLPRENICNLPTVMTGWCPTQQNKWCAVQSRNNARWSSRNFFDSIGLYEAHRGKINGFMLAITTDSLFRLPTGMIGKNEEEILFEDWWEQKSRWSDKLKTEETKRSNH